MSAETKRRALGKGLESLLPSRPASLQNDTIFLVTRQKYLLKSCRLDCMLQQSGLMLILGIATAEGQLLLLVVFAMLEALYERLLRGHFTCRLVCGVARHHKCQC